MRKYKPVTQKDISEALGLSTSTISRALNEIYGIGDTTRKLVLDYIEKIEYTPNPMALRLKNRCSNSIGVVVPEVANGYFSQVINGIESVAYQRGYHIIVSQTHESAQREIRNVQQFASQSIDGILVALASETSDMAHFRSVKDRGIPLVFFDRVPGDVNLDKITVDNYQGAYDATEYLIKFGCRKIAHLTTSSNLLISSERFRGYKEALNAYNIPFDHAYLFYCKMKGNMRSEVEKAITNWMSFKEKPDAIFSAGDQVSIECLMALKKFDIKIPEDISLICFANIEDVEIFESPLTTVSQPAFEVGKTATERLINQIENKHFDIEPATRILPTHFTIRSSVGKNLNSNL